jgi:tyrosinase
LAVLNGGGKGKFSALRDVHRDNTSDEAHTYPAFPHWHRSYLLDLERELQQIDPTVALPYWKFDEPAPNVFRLKFMGVADLSIPPHPDEQPPP